MSDVEEDRVEVKAANALVPNLTISVENDEETYGEEAVVVFPDEIKMEEPEIKTEGPVEVKLEKKSFPHTKIYENQALKDMGLTPEEARARKEKRGKRFQSPLLKDVEVKTEDAASTAKVQKLVKKVNEYNQIAEKGSIIRLDAVHLRGLDDMSTEEIFSFFTDLFPSHIEWLNDTSCNVVWKDGTSAPNAVLTMTKPNRRPSTAEKVVKQDLGENGGAGRKQKQDDDDDDLDLLESDDEMMDTEEEDHAKKQDMHTETAEVQEFTNDLRRCKKYFYKDGRKILLKIRLATMADKKVLGGAKKSKYYIKYGNPNYGNVKGILSRSFMKRFHGRVAKSEYAKFQPAAKDEVGDAGEPDLPKRAKVGSKRMYSEPEWEKAKKSKQNEDDVDLLGEEERRDIDLINSSAKDLDDAVPADKDIDDEEPGEDTMMADRIAKKIEAARRNQDSDSKSTSQANSVWARLGRKPQADSTGMRVTVNNDDSAVHRRRQRDEDKNVGSKLPSSLKARLGTRRY